jgi:putative ABC transport system permease protein
MLRHLFKLIWNKKKQNFLLMFEMLISFMVVFAVCTLLVSKYQNYRKPMGFNYEQVWTVNFDNSLKTNNVDSISLFYENVRRTLEGMPQIRAASFSFENFPFSNSINGTDLKLNNRHVMVYNYNVGEGYKDVLQLKVLEGRWFGKQDLVAKDKPVVITAALEKEYFPNDHATGKLITNHSGDRKMRVIGVVQDIKDRGDYADSEPGLFNLIDTSNQRWANRILIKVSSDAGAAFEGRLFKTLAGIMKDANLEISHLADLRRSKNKETIIPVIVLLVVAGFLIINVALGIFGVLWYNINKRRSEIGLRRAVGATGNNISKQLVGEAMVLTTIAMLAGSFFAVQFPLLHVFNIESGIWFTALALSLAFIYLLVLICALYPGRQASAIQPAVALHED